MPNQWTDNNNDQWVDTDVDQWSFTGIVYAAARYITKSATFFFSTVKNTFRFKSKENKYHDIT